MFVLLHKFKIGVFFKQVFIFGEFVEREYIFCMFKEFPVYSVRKIISDKIAVFGNFGSLRKRMWERFKFRMFTAVFHGFFPHL